MSSITHEEKKRSFEKTSSAITEEEMYDALSTIKQKLSRGESLKNEDLFALILEIRENDIRHLKEDIERLKSTGKRSAKSVLLGLSIMLWVATPITFLSVPLIGLVCAIVATFSTIGYAISRSHVA